MINYLFPIPLYNSKIENNTFLNLKENVLEYIENNKELFNTDNWNCNTKTNIFCDSDKKFLPDYLKNIIIEHTSRYIVESGFETSPFLIEDCWITLGEEGAYQELHDHLGSYKQQCHFSGVMYIETDMDSGGEFVISSPIDIMTKLLPKTENIPSEVHITPEESLLLMFPSWLKHGTLQYKSTNKKRISISWNIILI
jgi:uncharacterized protein (TIGR02466 family)